jgi:hypothetical protein
MIFSIAYADNKNNQNSLIVEKNVTVPGQYVVPRVSSFTGLSKQRIPRDEHDLLQICINSCKERGSMYSFQCFGQQFQPFKKQYRCICYDDLN